MQDDTLKRSSDLTEAQYSVVFPRVRTPLHAMLTGCGYQRINPADDYDWHGLQRGRSEFAVFQYTLSGRGQLSYENREIPLRPGAGMLVTIPHNHRYYLPAVSAGWEFLYTCLSGREIMGLCRDLIQRRGPIIELGLESKPVQAVLKMVKMASSDGFTSPYTVSSAAYSLTMALLEAGGGTESAASPPAPIRRACDYCRTNFAGPIGIQQMAGAAHWSRAHFSRQFKLAMQMTPVEYLTELRLRKVVRLLQETDLTLKEIAPLCGFPDGNYLGRIFRRVYGVTPGAFRRTGMY